MNRILMVMNSSTREQRYFEIIRRFILELDSTAEVKMHVGRDPGYLAAFLKHRPNIVLTYPFTSRGLCHAYYLLKLFYGTRIVTLRTEGAIDTNFKNFEEVLDYYEGFDEYGRELVDLDLHWGKDLSEPLGRRLVHKGKLSSTARSIAVGYPRFEWSIQNRNHVPENQDRVFEKFERRNRILILTGFQMADYREEDFLRAGDLNAEKNLALWLRVAKATLHYRETVTHSLSILIQAFPNYLFILKNHPLEDPNTYLSLPSASNFYRAPKEQDIFSLTEKSGVMFHYGSTSLADAYLSQIPTVLYRSKEYADCYGASSWPNSDLAPLEDLIEFFRQNYLPSPKITYQPTAEIAAILEGSYGYSPDRPFEPCKQIASLLLDLSISTQKLNWRDRYLFRALLWGLGQFLRKIRKTLENLLRSS